MKVWNSSLEFSEKYDIVSPSLHYDSYPFKGKKKRIPKVHTHFVRTGLDGMSRSHNAKYTFKSLFTGRFFAVIDNLTSYFSICFNKDIIDIVDATKYLQPFDSFKSFDENNLNVLHDHYLGDFSEHTYKKLLLNEHTYYKKSLIKEFEKKELEKMTSAKVSVWINQNNSFPLITKLFKLICVMTSST